jgi:hypothetical protein
MALSKYLAWNDLEIAIEAEKLVREKGDKVHFGYVKKNENIGA